MAKGFFERTGNVKKLKEILDNLPAGTVITKKELSRLSGATTKTITNVLARDYPNPKFIIPDAATAQAMTVKKNVEKRMQNVETPSPITTNRTVSGIRWPNDTVKNSYIEDLKKKYSFTKGTTPEFSNKALALKYFGKDGAGEIAKIERINNFLVKDLNLKYAPGSPRETYLRRKSRIDESKKFLTDREKTILNKQQSQKKLLNKFFQTNPEAINDPKYQKVKNLMNARFKDGKVIFDIRDDAYYLNKAKGGKLFDIFDISAVASEKRNIRFPSNINITPGQFNQAFFKQLTTYFEKNPNDTKALNEVDNFLKSYGIRAEIPALKKRIGETSIAAIDEAGNLPNIENTLNKLGLDRLVPKEYIPAKKISNLTWNNDIGAFVNTATDNVESQAEIKTWAKDNPMPVQAGTSVKPGLLRKTGRALAHLGLPLPTAALDSYFIGRQIEEGRDATEIAKDPFNWLGLATMEPLTKAAGVADKSGKLASVMRLGMSPGMIRGATRFLGLPGLALSTGLTAYDQYKKYQNKEGFVYDLFNKEEIDNTSV